MSAARRKGNTAQQRISRLKVQLEDSRNDVENLNEEIDQRNRENTELQEENERLKRERDDARLERDEAEEYVDKASDELFACLSAFRRLALKANGLRTEEDDEPFRSRY
jgi:regulator of replication initiation timing